MIVCVCKAISEKDLKENPKLQSLVGTGCGKCLYGPPWQCILPPEKKLQNNSK